MNAPADLDDRRLASVARQAGRALEAVMARGDIEAAHQAKNQMYTATKARIAAREPCYFVTQGDLDRLALQGAQQ